MKKWSVVLAFALFVARPVLADPSNCGIPASTVAALQAKLAIVIALPDSNGGIFTPNRMWSAIVDRQGVLCSVINSGNDPWPGSRAIAIAKASTANDFSNSALALSTANLYAPTQPGGSLYGLNNSNPFNSFFEPQSLGVGFVPGGIITFGGGVALYSGGKVIGGLGVSGDSSCADHAIAFRMRKLAGLDGIPAGQAPDNTDNIIYAPLATQPTGFQQPTLLSARPYARSGRNNTLTNGAHGGAFGLPDGWSLFTIRPVGEYQSRLLSRSARSDHAPARR